MKKGLTRGLVTAGVALFAVAALAACGSKTSDTKSESKTIDDLKISFVPSFNNDAIGFVAMAISSGFLDGTNEIFKSSIVLLSDFVSEVLLPQAASAATANKAIPAVTKPRVSPFFMKMHTPQCFFV